MWQKKKKKLIILTLVLKNQFSSVNINTPLYTISTLGKEDT